MILGSKYAKFDKTNFNDEINSTFENRSRVNGPKYVIKCKNRYKLTVLAGIKLQSLISKYLLAKLDVSTPQHSKPLQAI